MLLAALFSNVSAFLSSFDNSRGAMIRKLQMAEVDLVFPGNKKCKAASGSLLKDGNESENSNVVEEMLLIVPL